MRLRRECGDFDISIKSNAATTAAGLKAENFIGYVIEDGGSYYVVTSAVPSDGTITLGTSNSATYTYTVATGAVAKA